MISLESLLCSRITNIFLSDFCLCYWWRWWSDIICKWLVWVGSFKFAGLVKLYALFLFWTDCKCFLQFWRNIEYLFFTPGFRSFLFYSISIMLILPSTPFLLKLHHLINCPWQYLVSWESFFCYYTKLKNKYKTM